MEAWIPITLAAAFFQNLRSALQKHLTGRLSTAGATYSRFCYAVVLAGLYALVLVRWQGYAVPAPNPRFLAYAAFGGSAQMIATALLVHLFSYRNFAVGTTYSKTETVQTAIFGIVILGDPLSLLAATAIGVSLAGVMAISVGRGQASLQALTVGLTSRPALIGIASGGCFGISIVCYRAASLSLAPVGFVMQAAFTLACVTAFQTVVMGIYLRLREPGQLGLVLATWRVGSVVGLAGTLASVCWLTAATIENAAYVRALGQVELVFTFAASALFFHERPTGLEVAGIVLVIGGIVLLLLA